MRRAALRALVGASTLLMAWTAGASELVAEPALSRDGVYRLTWEADGEVRLEEADDPSFESSRTVYAGRDRATVLTGRRDGDYYYRLRVDDAVAAGPVRARVAHHSFSRALIFFAVGGAVFVATVLLVTREAEREPGPERAGERSPRDG